MIFGKNRFYSNVLFLPEVFERVISIFESVVKPTEQNPISYRCTYAEGKDDLMIQNPNLDYRKNCFSSNYFKFFAQSGGRGSMFIFYDKSSLDITLDGFADISTVNALLYEFQKSHEVSKLPLGQALKSLTVFIGHGRSRQWRDLKDHLTDHHGINVEAYETGARAGFTIQEILEELSSKASLALLVHTGEDIDRDGQLHSRENVIHETGLFQAKLSFKRAIVLLEEGATEFSNIAGLQQARFKKDNIKEVFGEVLAIIRRQFLNNKRA